jgi:hypothetical protein
MDGTVGVPNSHQGNRLLETVMTECDFVREIYMILGLRWPITSMSEAIKTLEETQALAATGSLPERWTLNERKENETPMRNMQ